MLLRNYLQKIGLKNKKPWKSLEKNQKPRNNQLVLLFEWAIIQTPT